MRRRRTASTCRRRCAAAGGCSVACFHPILAKRTPLGGVVLVRKMDDSFYDLSHEPDTLWLPCGKCIGCRKARAREWALRCTLEASQHDRLCWSTLTYDDAHLPPTLQRRHLQLWFKRMRKRLGSVGIRFFATGEYGERTFRPHYHAILFGLEESSSVPQAAWPHGFVRVDPLTPAAISYVAGYCSKKLGWSDYDREERIDYATGEVYKYQPPFVQMSRRPGIGGAARAFRASWRSYAVLNGRRMPVPRFLHASWREGATDEDVKQLEAERAELRRDISLYSLMAGEATASTLHEHSSVKRTKL